MRNSCTPESKKILNQRKSMVEPVFSALRGIQGLERFRRKGLLAVKLEFTLHAMAYNLSRAVALILWMIFSLLFVQTKIRKRENLHGGILLKKKFHPFCDSLSTAALRSVVVGKSLPANTLDTLFLSGTASELILRPK
nr:transposase [Arsenophonus sp. ENCA]